MIVAEQKSLEEVKTLIGEAEKVPLLKSKNDLYYKDFVNKVRLLSKQLSDN